MVKKVWNCWRCERRKVADNKITQLYVFYWFNLHKTDMRKEVGSESGGIHELVQWVTNPWLEITCNWILTQDRGAVSSFLNFSWRVRAWFKAESWEVYHRNIKKQRKKKKKRGGGGKKNFCGEPDPPASHAEVVVPRYENLRTRSIQPRGVIFVSLLKYFIVPK